MAKLYVNDQPVCVFNWNTYSFLMKWKLIAELDIPVGTVCRVEHCAQDHSPDETFIVEESDFDYAMKNKSSWFQ